MERAKRLLELDSSNHLGVRDRLAEYLFALGRYSELDDLTDPARRRPCPLALRGGPVRTLVARDYRRFKAPPGCALKVRSSRAPKPAPMPPPATLAGPAPGRPTASCRCRLRGSWSDRPPAGFGRTPRAPISRTDPLKRLAEASTGPGRRMWEVLAARRPKGNGVPPQEHPVATGFCLAADLPGGKDRRVRDDDVRASATT